MASSIPSNPTSHNVAALLPKLTDPDSDIRFMTLNDIHQILIISSQTFLSHDYTTSSKLVEGLLKALNDNHGDVQNQAIKCLGPFVQKAPDNILGPTVEKVSNMEPPQDITIPALALRTIITALPHPVAGAPRTKALTEAYHAISKSLIPRLLGKTKHASQGMLELDIARGEDSNSLDVLSEVARSFGPMLSEGEINALQSAVMGILSSDRASHVLRKKAVTALSTLAPYFSDPMLAHLVSNSIESLRQTHLTNQQRRTFLHIYESIARAIPQKFGPFLTTLVPFVLSPLSQLELDQQQEAEAESGERDTDFEEVREAALSALETFFQTCADNMQTYINDSVEATIRFMKYDPTFVDDAEDDVMEEDDEFEAEEDFEEDTGFEDEDDISWKVRRDSVRALHALITSLSPDERQIYVQVAPELLSRFKEREEAVRNEVVATLTTVITKNGTSEPFEQSLPVSRKRRRGGSDAFVTDQALINGYASPSTPPPSDDLLARMSPEIVAACSKLLKQSTASTKLAVIHLLRALVLSQRGSLSKNADQVIDPVLESIDANAGNALCIEALSLLSAIAESHSGKALQSHLGKIVSFLVGLTKDRYARTASEAFAAIESYIKVFTPPRSAAARADNGQYLTKFHHAILARLTDGETEVREKALRALGLLVGRTSGPLGSKLLAQSARYECQAVILERLQNELTRLAAVRAFNTIAIMAQSKTDWSAPLLNNLVVDLGAQLRKSSRSLRGASLSTIRAIIANDASRANLTANTLSALISLLLPLIQGNDLHMLGPALVILSVLATSNPALVATGPVNAALTQVAASSISGSSFEALIDCVTSLGHAGQGNSLMQMLLQLGVSGDIDVLGRVIGALLVASGKSSPYQLQDFTKELETTDDSSRQCLAVSVLGEAGLRLGQEFPVSPELFLARFTSSSEKVKLAAAVALGRAGAGNVKVFLPVIMDALVGQQQYLVLHSVKELLHHSKAENEIRPMAQVLWEHIINSGQSEDNRIVSAECIGRLAIVDPVSYLTQLQKLLEDSNATTRGMVMIALRYVFSDTDEAYDVHLKDTIYPMLATVLNDTDLDNQRLALSAFDAAFQNKPVLLAPHIGQLLKSILPATHVRAELVREVSMGPFKHKVDDGLDIRKSAYETMYVLLEQPISRQHIDLSALYDRVIAGIADDHEIKIVSCLLLSRLISLAKDESARRLETVAQAFRTVLSFKPKDTAVKQELEKIVEHNKAILKVTLQLNKAIATSESRVWRDYFEWVRREFPVPLKAIEDEVKSAAA